MTQYELLYIVPMRYTEDELNPIKQKVRESIENAGGKILLDDSLGKKKLAYPVKKIHQGYYLLNHFELEPARLSSLDRNLRLTDEIIRHIIVKYEAKTVFKIEKIREGLQASSDIFPREGMTERVAPPKQEPKKAEEKTEEKEKVNLEDLDKKLDEILKTDNLL